MARARFQSLNLFRIVFKQIHVKALTASTL